MDQPLLSEEPMAPTALSPGGSATTQSGFGRSSSGDESGAGDVRRVEYPEGSPTSWIEVGQGIERKIPDLLRKLQVQMEKGFEDTRVLEAQGNFIEDVLRVPRQLILTHSCVALGPAGAGKTTLVKALSELCGAAFEPHVPAGPHLENRTMVAQSCDLKLDDLSEDLTVVLIDTPGWSHDTSTDIKFEYKKLLKEKHLVSEHTPHIILFCIPVSMIRQFHEGEARKMSKQLQELKFDQRFPIKVVPVATKADAEHTEELGTLMSTIKTRAETAFAAELGALMSTIKARAETAFAATGAQVEEPVYTKLPPEGEHDGVKNLKRCLSEILHEQIESSEFRDLWQKAFAKSVAERTEWHKEFPENDSALRLFSAWHTADTCGIQNVSGLGKMSGAVEDLPWR